MSDSDWTNFALYTDVMVKKMHKECDILKDQNKEKYTKEDFSHFDALHYCGHDWLKEFFAQQSKDALKCLEVGSGIGGGSRIAALDFGAEVVALDYLQGYTDVHNRINEMCGGIPSIKVETGDALEMDLDALGCNGNCDIVFSIQVFYMICDKPSLFTKLANALKPGGKLYIEDWVLQTEEPMTEEEETAAKELGFLHRLTQNKYVELLESFGFRVDVYEDNTTHWARYIYSRGEGFLQKESQMKSNFGEEWWEHWTSWALFKVTKAYHNLEMTYEEQSQKFPLLMERLGGREFYDKWSGVSQKFGGNKVIATKL